MQVLSPVGRFPLKITGLRLRNGPPAIRTEMGVWRSDVILERRDLPMIAAAAATLVAAFVLGRVITRGKEEQSI